MEFPHWIDNHRKKATKAPLRLKYMLSRLVRDRYPAGNVKNLADEMGCNQSTIYNAIKRGYFTPQLAERIEKVFGSKVLPAEWLTNPLAIGQGD